MSYCGPFSSRILSSEMFSGISPMISQVSFQEMYSDLGHPAANGRPGSVLMARSFATRATNGGMTAQKFATRYSMD